MVRDESINGNFFPCYLPFMRGVHSFPVDSPSKGHWRRPLMFSLRLNIRVSKQSRCRWFETPSRLLWRNYLKLKSIGTMSTNERPLNHISMMFMRKPFKFHQILWQNLNEDIKWRNMIRDHWKPKTLCIKICWNSPTCQLMRYHLIPTLFWVNVIISLRTTALFTNSDYRNRYRYHRCHCLTTAPWYRCLLLSFQSNTPSQPDKSLNHDRIITPASQENT